MKELIRRLAAHPWLALEMILASLCANLLALASPLFVSQVLDRYVTSGVDATLATLTVGVTVAIILEWGFRQARLRLALTIGTERDRALNAGAMGILTTARGEDRPDWSAARRSETLRGLRTIHSAYSAPNLVAVLDLPFSLLYIITLLLLSLPLGLIASGFMMLSLLAGFAASRLTRQPLRRLGEINLRKESLVTTASARAKTIRLFGATRATMQRWLELEAEGAGWHRHLEARQGLFQGVQGMLQATMSVAIIAVGAVLAVAGELQVGTLIGANILASRAMGPILRVVGLTESMLRAEAALARLEAFSRLPVEPGSGATLRHYQGGVEFRDLAKSLPSTPIPLFESLSLTLAPGSVLVVTGDDGTGKSVLAGMIAGMIEPDRGQILADGVDVRQLDPAWWRRQLILLPKDPEFVDGTLRENLTRFDPELPVETLQIAIADAGLGPWLDESPQGLNTPVNDGHTGLTPGLRKRLALARALTSRGNLAIFDEPTEELDHKGEMTVYAVLRKLSLRGATVIVFTNDPVLLRAATLLLDLNTRPTPTLIRRPPEARPA
ncbi:MAG: ATP-binding cassette domain-containing protein [Magnetococcales bacterium]|nr:ATP-binding cassette domain-containing protein [Magnetococcales bacterium]